MFIILCVLGVIIGSLCIIAFSYNYITNCYFDIYNKELKRDISYLNLSNKG